MELSLLDQHGEVVVDVLVAEEVGELACSEAFLAGIDQGGDGGKEVAPPGEAGVVVLTEAVIVEPCDVGVCEDRAVAVVAAKVAGAGELAEDGDLCAAEANCELGGGKGGVGAEAGEDGLSGYAQSSKYIINNEHKIF